MDIPSILNVTLWVMCKFSRICSTSQIPAASSTRISPVTLWVYIPWAAVTTGIIKHSRKVEHTDVSSHSRIGSSVSILAKSIWLNLACTCWLNKNVKWVWPGTLSSWWVHQIRSFFASAVAALVIFEALSSHKVNHSYINKSVTVSRGKISGSANGDDTTTVKISTGQNGHISLMQSPDVPVHPGLCVVSSWLSHGSVPTNIWTLFYHNLTI